MFNRSSSRAAPLLVASSFLALCAGAALADEAAAPSQAPASTPDAAEAAGQVQEVIVTVQKRAQNKIDVPIALTAYNGDFLQKMGVYDLHDASLYIPGVYEENHSVNDPVILIRGQSSDSEANTADPRISVFEDGVDISRQGGAYTELFDMERLEVSKGPQTTLFGRSAEVGAVSEIENKADPSAFDWSLKAEGGNYNYNLFQGMVNIPLSDDFAVRLAYDHRDRDGYINNLSGGGALNAIDSDAGRIGFTWRPNDRLHANLIFNYERDDPTSESFKSGTFEPTNPKTGAVLGDTNPFTPAYLAGSIDGKSLGLRREVYGVTSLIDLKINDAFTLHSTSAYRKFDGEEVFDPDGFSFPLLTVGDDEHQHQVSQDFRLNWSPPSSAVSGFVGASYFEEYDSERVPELYDEPELLALLTGTLNRTSPNPGPESAYSNPAVIAAELRGLAGAKGYALSPTLATGIADNMGMHEEASTTSAATRAYDVYGDFSWKATDRLTFDAGLRVTDESKTTSFVSQVDGTRSILGGVIGALGLTGAERQALLSGLAAPGAATLPQSAAYPVPDFALQDQPTSGVESRSLSYTGVTWRVNATYKLAPQQNVYASYGRGELPPSISAGPPSAPGGAAVFTQTKPEQLDSYEVGYKGLVLDRHLELEGALYYYNYSDFQVPVLVGAQFLTEDAGQATTYGFEGTATWRFNRDFDVFANYAYTHGQFDSGAYKGDQFQQTPENAFSLGGTARFDAPGGQVYFTPSYVYRSKVFFSDANDNPAITAGQLITPLVFNEYQNGYGLLNMRFGYAPDKAHWKIELFCSNCSNTQYLKDAGDTGEDIGIPAYIAGEPAMYGVSFTIRR